MAYWRVPLLAVPSAAETAGAVAAVAAVVVGAAAVAATGAVGAGDTTRGGWCAPYIGNT
ncbi:MAG: hypothetical protein FWE28_01830 [Oscillospiraceae bacterium]|nr:hypothetical protein [Oscillospiraceae bacterium]